MNRGIIGFGALNADLVYECAYLGEGRYSDRLEGELYIASKEMTAGGSARNTVYTAAMLGVPTGYIGVVGSDHHGDFLLRNLAAACIDTKGVKTISQLTGYCLILTEDAKRLIVAYPGANDKLRKEDVDLGIVNGYDAVHFTSFVLGSGQGPLEAQIYVAENAAPNVARSFSPGKLYTRNRRVIDPLLRRTNVLFANRDEMRDLTGKDYREGSRELLDALADNPVVICTRGSEGVYARTQTSEYDIPGVDATREDDGKLVYPNTVGAGDRFAGVFWALRLRGNDIGTCLDMANKAVARSLKFGRYPLQEDLTS